MATIGVPNHRCVLSIFPVKMTHEWRHNGISRYEHEAAPRDKILRRTFGWQIGQYCPEHPQHAPNNQAMQNNICGYQMGDKRICRLQLEERPRWTDVYTDCEKDQGYAVYEIPDARCWGRDWNNDKEVYRADPVDAQSIVTDFIGIYSSGMPGTDKGYRPGIVAIGGDEPTADELAQVRAMQTAYFEFLFHDAVALSINPQTAIDISGLHRRACEWLGRFDLPFMVRAQQRAVKECPACAEVMPAKANRCNSCATNLDDWYMSRGLMPDVKQDPFVHGLIERIRLAKSDKRVLYAKKEPAIATELAGV